MKQYFLIGTALEGGDEVVLDSSNKKSDLEGNYHHELPETNYPDYKDFRILEGSLKGVRI